MSKIIRIEIEKYEHLRERFSDKYITISKNESYLDESLWEGRTQTQFIFEVNYKKILETVNNGNSIKSKSWDDIFKYYRGLKNKYKLLENENKVSFKIEVKFEITKNEDYHYFYTGFIKKHQNVQRPYLNSNKKLIIKDEYYNCNICFSFVVNILEGTKFDGMLVHNFIVIAYKTDSISLILKVENNNDDEENEFRLKKYLSNLLLDQKATILFNGKPIKYDSNNTAKKLLPAIWIDEKILSFLQKPISKKDWQIMKQQNLIELHGSNKSKVEKNLLKTCSAYLYGQMYKSSNKNYIECRKEVFKNELFQKEILSMSFLSLFIFAQYDYFYRSYLLEKYKMECGYSAANFDIQDFKLSLQRNQSIPKYEAYCRLKEKGYDIKNFWAGDSDKDQDLHNEIIAELFEAKSIAEGMLQIMENAVLHAGGGLLSIIIYLYDWDYNQNHENNKIENDNMYLQKRYSRHFSSAQSNIKDNEKVVRNIEFFLEIKISDISDKDIWEKFTDNIKERYRKQKGVLEEINKELSKLEQSKEEGPNIYERFFVHNNFKELESYYNRDENRIWHFGLPIFDSIVNSKNGSFVVSGFGVEYLDPKLTESEIYSDKNLFGTSYQILMPLKYYYTKNKNNVSDIRFFSKRLTNEELRDYYIAGNLNCINYFEKLEGELSIIKENKTKKEMINDLKKSIEDTISEINSKYVVVFDFSREEIKKISISNEIMMKSLLGAWLKADFKPPVIFLGLNTYQILEFVRLLALFYDRRGENKAFKSLQFFLRGEKIGEEIIIAGDDLKKIAYYMQKTAMTNGLMHDFWQIADRLIGRGE